MSDIISEYTHHGDARRRNDAKSNGVEFLPTVTFTATKQQERQRSHK